VHARPRGTGACAARSSSSCVQYAPPRLEPWPCPQHPRVRQHGACKGRRPAPAREATRAAPKPPKHSQSPAGPDGAPVHRAHARTRADAWPGHRASSAHEHSAPRRVLDPPPPLAIRMGGGGPPRPPPPPLGPPPGGGGGRLRRLRHGDTVHARGVCRHRRRVPTAMVLCHTTCEQRARCSNGVGTDQGPSSTKVCAPTKLRARPRFAHRPSSELDQVPSSTKVCAPTKVRAQPCAPTKVRARPSSEFDQGVHTDQGPSSTVRTDQGPSSTKVRAGPCAPSKVRARPSSEFDQGVHPDQGPSSTKVRAGPCAPTKVRTRPRSEFDQGVHPDQGPSSTKVRAGPCAPSQVRARPRSPTKVRGALALVELGPWSVCTPWSVRTHWSSSDRGRSHTLVELGHWSVRTQ